MATDIMGVYSKMEFIKDAGLGTSGLVVKLDEQTDFLEKLLKQLVEHKSKESDNLGGRSSDSKAMKAAEEEIAKRFPSDPAKKTTIQEKEAWINDQKKIDPAWKKATDAHKMAEFVVDDCESQIKLAETRIGNLRSVINLRSAQLAFFTGKILIELEEEDDADGTEK